MTRTYKQRGFDLWLFMKKFALSGFVMFSFIAYVIDQHFLAAKQATTPQPATDPTSQPQAALNPSYYALPGSNQTNSNTNTNTNTQTDQSLAQVQPTQAPAPTQAPTAIPPTATAQGQYRDGTFNGNVTDAWYGPMQVQAVIQGGKLTQVQILQYPHDRRTSQEINSQALPWLEQEAVQAQNAQIDFISGATLSSNAFIESLSSALQSAKS